MACAAVHRVLFERGFPCPGPLVELEPFGEMVGSAEAMIGGGHLLPDSGRSAGPFAETLANLVALAPRPQDVGSLEPAPPWTTPDDAQPGLWPWPDDRDDDLNAVDGPHWVDEARRSARDRLRSPSR